MAVMQAKEATVVAHAAAAQRRAAAARERADTTTPLPNLTSKTLQDPSNGQEAESTPATETKARPITLQTTVEHRGRTFVISAEGITLDQFCDLLDRRGYAAPEKAQEWQTLPDGTPICPKHHTPMRQREKQGDSWWSHNVGTKDAPIYCKGYHGKDSPGYEN